MRRRIRKKGGRGAEERHQVTKFLKGTQGREKKKGRRGTKEE